MKERFSNDEWAKLKLIPIQMFVLVAGADGTIDKKEVESLSAELLDAVRYKNELNRELFADILHDDMDKLTDDAAEVSPDDLKAILQGQLAADEYQDFVISLIGFGFQIARASGGGLLGGGDPVSKKERMALAAFASAYELDLKRLEALMSS